ncbi:glycosyl hydrolase family 3 N terminal domain-containing protein [Russula emetica]|nr:glycosyl hydrolase family 3 N terminal domain-containing protein [Russula emetica]
MIIDNHSLLSTYCSRCVDNIPPIDDLPGLCLEDSPLGVRFADFVTAFSAAINAASTWKRSLLRARGVAMGKEHVGKGVNIALGPMMNIGRRVAQGECNVTGRASARTLF